MRIFLVGAVAAAMVLLGASAALATNPNDSQYGNAAAQATPPSSAAKGAFTPPSEGGTLPFTGLDLGLVVASGLIVIAGGVALRRAGRKQSGEH